MLNLAKSLTIIIAFKVCSYVDHQPMYRQPHANQTHATWHC